MALTNIKVIGIGGGGGNTIDRMMQCGVKGVELIAVNTDVQDLKKIKAHKKIRIGMESTQGLGAGMNPEVGRKAAQETAEELGKALSGADMVFLAAGLGGGTGSGAIPEIAAMAKAQGALTIAVVTKPFAFEGAWRAKIAERALELLKGKVDTLLVVPNDQILKLTDQDSSVLSAFWHADEVLRQAVQGISDIITLPGIINLDFADIKSVMMNSGQAVFGMGNAKGENRVETALDTALNSPLLTMSIEGAKSVLFNVSGLDDLSIAEVYQVAEIIKAKASPNAKIIFGAVKDRSLKQGEVRVTILATGFKESA